VSNIGNERINVSAYAYGLFPQDGLAMNCTQNNISIGSERFALTPSVAFAAKTPLTTALSPLNLLIDEQTTPGPAPDNKTYWQLEAPVVEQPQGNCTGILVFQAEAE
ncbi:hypothetical protein GOV10_00005, partial [Candidatus Woesearchaeota archaeon]|nr:hypothetical protein [Candidatus Woesearchaeota archaeon]